MNKRDQKIIADALAIMEKNDAEYFLRDCVENPKTAATYARLTTFGLENEVFGAIWLDNKHRVISAGELFGGTIDSASVWPREVVKAALKVNAAACVFFHNHPSRDPEPSNADDRITEKLKQALALLDIKTVDHIVVGGARYYSYAEHGKL